MMFGVIGIPIKKTLGLTNAQFGLLTAMPVLTGSLIRVPLGVWTDRFGGRIVLFITMMLCVAPIYLMAYATQYWQFLVLGMFVGLAGGSFSVGTPYVARWFPKDQQGFAMGVFGAGNSGAAVNKFIAPVIVVICAVGAYTVHSHLLDVWLMIVFGLMGYAFKKLKYPLAPLVLALVLGDMAELIDIAEDSPVWPYVTSTADNCLGQACPNHDDAAASAAFGARATHFPDREALTAALADGLQADQRVLVKGSRFMKMERVVAHLTGSHLTSKEAH